MILYIYLPARSTAILAAPLQNPKAQLLIRCESFIADDLSPITVTISDDTVHLPAGSTTILAAPLFKTRSDYLPLTDPGRTKDCTDTAIMR